jgi:hypothetical protein
MRRINYTSAAYDTIVLEIPWDLGTDCVPPPQIVIYRRDGDGLVSRRSTTIGVSGRSAS